MDRTSTTTTGYDIWNEIPELENYQTSTNGGRHFEPQSNLIPINWGRHFKLQINSQTHTGWARHFKPPHLETDNPMEALKKSTQQTPAKEDEVLKQLQKTQANISL